jgi:hypothetical protein
MFYYLCMQISYNSNKLEKSVSTPREIQKNYGTRAKLVSQRMAEIKTSASLAVLGTIPKANCHQLSNNLSGKLAVDISANHRIIFEPDHDPIPRKEDGGLDWSQVIKIKILSIGTDYH